MRYPNKDDKKKLVTIEIGRVEIYCKAHVKPCDLTGVDRCASFQNQESAISSGSNILGEYVSSILCLK